jgi:hypothetical protein
MEGFSKLTESFLPFVVLIVIAGVRIVAMVRRRARNREQGQRDLPGPQPVPGGVPQKGAGGFHPWEDEYRDPAGLGDPDDDEFSAWSLSIDNEEPVELPKKVPAVPSETVKAAASVPEPANRPLPARHGIESRIRLLPPLQQGVVWAEILGTPKGL